MSAEFAFTPLKKRNKEGSISTKPFNSPNDDNRFSSNFNPSFSYNINPNVNNLNNPNTNFPYRPSNSINNPPQSSYSNLNSPFHQEKLNNLNNNKSSSAFDNQLYNNQNNNYIINNRFSNLNEYQYNLNRNNYNQVQKFYLSITGFDQYTKKTLLKFFERQNISSSDIKTLGNDKFLIIIRGDDNKFRFTNVYNEIREQLMGVEIREISENEFNDSINNIITRGNMGYDNYDEINETVSLPQKSNWQKFLDVFLNL